MLRPPRTRTFAFFRAWHFSRKRCLTSSSQLTTQMFTADLRHKEIDAAVRFGDGAWEDGTATFLFDEEVFPGLLTEMADLAWHSRVAEGRCKRFSHRIRCHVGGLDAMGGAVVAVGFRPERLSFSLRCTLYTDAIQAARYGQGIALGWGRLVHDLLNTGELVRLPRWNHSRRPTPTSS